MDGTLQTIDGRPATGRITELAPPHVVAWTWRDQRFRFELHPDGDGCVLIFTHAFDPRLGPAAQHAAGWETYLDRLDAHLAGAFLSEEAAHEAFPALRERYAEAFGVDRPPSPAQKR